MQPERPKEGRWIARPKRPRWIAPGVLFIILASQAPNWINIFFSASHHSLSAMITIAIIAAVFLFAICSLLLVRTLRQRVRPEDRALLDESFGDQYLVEVTIVVGKDRLGTDRGVLWFSDGLMGFSGNATSFVLSGEDIRLQWKNKKRDTALPSHAILLQGAPRFAYFVVHPIGAAARKCFERLNLFELMGTKHEGERVWPPLVPYKDGQTLSTARRQGLGS